MKVLVLRQSSREHWRGDSCLGEDRRGIKSTNASNLLPVDGLRSSRLHYSYGKEVEDWNLICLWDKDERSVPRSCCISPWLMCVTFLILFQLENSFRSKIESKNKYFFLVSSCSSLKRDHCCFHDGWALLQMCHLGLKFMEEFVELNLLVHKHFSITLLHMSIKFTMETPTGG